MSIATRILAALAVLAANGCFIDCECPMTGELLVEVFERGSVAEITAHGEACDKTTIRCDSPASNCSRVTINAQREGSCRVEVQWAAGLRKAYSAEFKNESENSCCPGGLYAHPRTIIVEVAR